MQERSKKLMEVRTQVQHSFEWKSLEQHVLSFSRIFSGHWMNPILLISVLSIHSPPSFSTHQDLQTCTASNWATQLLGEYAENINECHGDAPDAEENFQSEEVQTSQTSQTSQPSAIPSTPSAASAPLRRPSRPITAPMTPVTRPPFRCGMGLSSSRKRPCSAGRLKGYRSTCSTATPEELQLNGQSVGPAGSASAFCPSERGTHNGEYGEGCRDLELAGLFWSLVPCHWPVV